MTETNDLMEKIVSLCKRRGFVFPGSEIYGGLANSWSYGPYGVELKNNVKKIPELRFYEDDTLDYVEKMDQLFEKIKKEES